MEFTNQLFTQCVGLVANEKNQKKLRTYIIDPLVAYFKYKLRFFFILIIVLLVCLLLTNIIMIGYCWNLRSWILQK